MKDKRSDNKDMTKIAALTDKDKSKLKKYWNGLLGREFSSDQVRDYKPKGKSIEQVAKKND
jgi:hypothetical protein